VHMADQFCVLDKDQLSARNSDVRPLTYFELLAEKFNDPLITFTTESLPELHQNFADPDPDQLRRYAWEDNCRTDEKEGLRLSCSFSPGNFFFWPLIFLFLATDTCAFFCINSFYEGCSLVGA
jgi:hypothetical protein